MLLREAETGKTAAPIQGDMVLLSQSWIVRLRAVVGEQHPANGAQQSMGIDSTAAHLNGLRVLLQSVIYLWHRQGRLGLLYAVTGDKRRKDKAISWSFGQMGELQELEARGPLHTDPTATLEIPFLYWAVQRLSSVCDLKWKRKDTDITYLCGPHMDDIDHLGWSYCSHSFPSLPQTEAGLKCLCFVFT